MKYTRLFALLCFMIILSGCKSNNSIKSEYDLDNGFIDYKERLWQDMFLKPRLDNDYVLYFTAYFYNYGGDIKLSDNFIDDYFIPLGHIQVIWHLENMNDIDIQDIYDDKKYGLYAVASWKLQDRTISNIFITPMAYSAYLSGNDENLIFVRFQGDKKQMDVIVCGDTFEKTMVKHGSKYIRESSLDRLLLDDNCFKGHFWHRY